ncbi:hypothetical protein ACHAW5_002221 [Stephanodiscus triporus]|uniref:Uncharacterized protein n=1 Tax=Stephanodiscus triporus TaxID=2934178 RepID=A0ABD3NSJ8_9STRA
MMIEEERENTPPEDKTITMSGSLSPQQQTKLGARAANSLREKRRVVGGSPPHLLPRHDNEAGETFDELHGGGGDGVVGSDDDVDDADRAMPEDGGGRGGSEETASFGGSTATARMGNHHPAEEICSATTSTSLSVGASCSSVPSDVGIDVHEHDDSPRRRAAREALEGAPIPGVHPEGTITMATREVNYEEGATELFMLVEDARWEEVCDRVRDQPSEARTWVVSSGTELTVFSWSVWRRLPLHEACRRQPPPVVIYSLLSAYPESVMVESNFGELPLHAVVRCGACAEVVNCILAAYPAAALARDNSGCTPLDILNGTGKMMDHDAVVAALNRTINVLTREDQAWESKISTMQAEAKKGKDRRRKEYERVVANKNSEIAELSRLLEQEKLATSNLATKVIQTEQVVLEKNKVEKRCLEKIRKGEEEIRKLVSSNNEHKAKIKELEDIIRSSRTTILGLNNRVQTLQSSMSSILQEEETFVATKLMTAERNFKTLVEHQLIFLRETEERKKLIKARMNQLGVKIPPKKNPEYEEEKTKAVALVSDEVSNTEVAEKALASAMEQLGIPPDEEEE